jgi:hypothetical protein
MTNLRIVRAAMVVVGGLVLGGVAAQAQPQAGATINSPEAGKSAPRGHHRMHRTDRMDRMARADSQGRDADRAYMGGGMVGYPGAAEGGQAGPGRATGGNPGGLGVSGSPQVYEPAGPPPVRTQGNLRQPGSGGHN